MPSVIYLIYLVLVITAALVAQYFFHSYMQSEWLIYIVLSLLPFRWGITFSQRTAAIAITGVGLAILAWIAGELSVLPMLLFIYLFLIIFIINKVTLHYPAYFFAGFIISLFLLLAALSTISIAENLQRSSFILLGTAIILVFQILYWPYFLRNQLQRQLIIVLKQTNKLTKEIFACFTPEFKDLVYLLEKRLHVQKKNFLHALNHFQQTALAIEKKQPNSEMSLNKKINQLNNLFEVLISMSLLRYRVTDYTIFTVCEEEMIAITNEISKLLIELQAVINGKKYHLNTQGLADKISKLTIMYQNILQVTAREPLVFLLFINDLKSLREEIEKAYLVLPEEIK